MISLVVNPTAGSGASGVIAEQAAACLESHNLPYEILKTSHPGEAVDLARAASDRGSSMVVAVGGDGTIREVAQGLSGTDTVMGILPGGRGNDFRRCLGIPESIPEALDILIHGRDKKIDLMEVNGEVCVNIYSLGFDCVVADYSRRFRILKGLSYYAAALYTCFAYRATPKKITLDDQVFDGKYYLVCFGNGTQYGGGFKIMPDAVQDDGQLDVCIIENVTVRQVLSLLPTVMNGTHKRFTDLVHFLRTRSITIETPAAEPAQADGDIIPPTCLTRAQVLPGALCVRVKA